MTAKRKSKKDEKIDFLEKQIGNNVVAIKEGPKKKHFTIYDLKSIKPITTSQKMMFESFIQGNHIVASGSAGSGKSYISLYLALNEILTKEKECNKIIIIRSIVQLVDVGFLPGNILEKIEPYEIPYKDIVTDLLKNKAAYDILKENGQLEFIPTSFIRGLTWDNAVIILDEAQNSRDSEINSIFTRLGVNSKLIICGDIEQTDILHKKDTLGSGFDKCINICKKMKSIDIINFTINDCVRSDFVKEWIIARSIS